MQVHIAKVSNLHLHTHADGTVTAALDIRADAMPLSAQPHHVKLDEQGRALPWSARVFAAMEIHDAGLIIDLRCLHRGNHESCMRYVEQSNFLGRKWRLGTVEELFLHVADRTRQNPAVNPDLYPMLKSEWLWSCTPDAAPEDPASPVCAWGVLLDGGYAGIDVRYDDGLALPVSPLASPSGQ